MRRTVLRAPRTRVKAQRALASRGRAALCMRPVAVPSRKYDAQDMGEASLADQALCDPVWPSKSLRPILPKDCGN